MAVPLLLTCFEPFAGRASNTSLRVIGPLVGRPPEGVTARVLPVDFAALRRLVPRVTRSLRPERWLLFGEDAAGEDLRCERIAVNVLAGVTPDNRGVLPSGKVVRGGPSAYFATLDPARIAGHFRKQSIPTTLSDSAGTYACNLALYLALHHSRRHGAPREVGFIHVPRNYRRTGRTLRELREAVVSLAETLVEDGARAA
jgi:pyroglutamyl-peptidase